MTRVLRFCLKPSHPDWVAAREHAVECRRLFNTINAVARESSSHRYDPKSDLTVCRDLGLIEYATAKPNLGSTYGFEVIRKRIEEKQSIVLPQKVAQRVGAAVAASWKSFYVLRKNGQTRARPPRFKQVYGTVEYTKQALSRKALMRKALIIPTGWKHGFALPPHVLPEQVQAARLIHSHDRVFVLDVIYNQDAKPPAHTIPGLSAGIDLGVDSLATIAFSDTSIRPLRVDGRKLKSINRFYNKRSAAHRAKLDREAAGIEKKLGVEKVSIPSAQLDALWKRRHRKVNHYLHTVSRAVVNAVAEIGVETVVIGWNEGFKSKSKMGKRNNQNFVGIPHARFRDMLTYKLEEIGITVLVQEESYTSKASFLDGDNIPVYRAGAKSKHAFSGRRITRGQYKASSGNIIHADVNGAYNIIRKSNQPMRLDKGIVVMPQRLKTPLGV